MRRTGHVLRGFSIATLLGACGGAASPATTSEEAEGPAVGLVSSEVVVKSCPDARRINASTAQATIRRLVGPCSGVPGGAAHFSAILMPGSRIELASPEGDHAEGVVPTCALKNQLRHGLALAKPCMLDVRLEERTLRAR